ncbi:MAG: 2-oxoisovalerate dehydrogenase [Ignavibacteria bacterium GWB2_35_12]|nr:MAG: 2-oxoisovalerate dehydrogenase [Ignavibacteria bacterium GWA2_35_8]OGU41131.1 MAG: 2-oxoisovalerate dehydrogenase [Ignavibacteria bacterium GWB2_35_12]OGU97234.1 MAG: 2-oxoisovalerate dehydrogenase [Ignavibacteria bacterium RIFOXYA2_FULL_35_10]OGV22948.1 MAG: 2-oxoisovalerate dehydrogenase [Ignavibacteria bacterium RIFOXYC2_FULL_35_21]
MGKEKDIILNCPFDGRNFTKETVLKWYGEIHLGRRLDDKAALYVKMAKGWSYHAPFAGHDGIQLATGKIFRQGKDFLFPYYRDLLTCLSAGMTVEEILLNGLSKEADVAGGGRHMSNHFAKPSIGIQNVSSCTGNHAQHAAGVARAIKKYNDDAIAIYSSGESACSEGYFWEAVNSACLEKLPVIFVIQNNKYGISVPVWEQTANAQISDNYSGMKNLMIYECNGRCPFNSFNTLVEAREYVLSGKGPAMVHADCDRMGPHSNSDPHLLYRTNEELEEAAKRDPMLQMRYTILDYKIVTEEELKTIEEENDRIIREEADRVEAMPNADGSSWEQFIFPEPYIKIEDNTEPESDANAPVITLREGINLALKEEFRLNPNTFLWGQDVASKNKQGVFNVCKGMLDEFGNERIFNSPIAENNIVGSANGFCRYRDDIRVVIEGAEFADYFWPAMDQYIECSHEYWRTKGQYTPNLVIRLASGGFIQGGLYHSQNLEGTFTTIPGIRVVNPAFADDAVGLMRNAIRSKGVTAFLEPKFIYNYKPAATLTPRSDFIVPFGKAKLRRTGTDVSIISYGTGVHLSLNAAKELEKDGISVEILDLRSLIPWDKKAVIEAVKKTNRVVIVHEDKVTGGFGGEISAYINSEAFNYLDAPVLRVGSMDCPVGFAKEYENAILPNVESVKESVRKVYRY